MFLQPPSPACRERARRVSTAARRGLTVLLAALFFVFVGPFFFTSSPRDGILRRHITKSRRRLPQFVHLFSARISPIACRPPPVSFFFSAFPSWYLFCSFISCSCVCSTTGIAPQFPQNLSCFAFLIILFSYFELFAAQVFSLLYRRQSGMYLCQSKQSSMK